MGHPAVKESMEQFMLQHVFVEFTAPEPYLRAIVRSKVWPAAEVLSDFCLINRRAKSSALWRNVASSGPAKR
jgi:hypothetical protein